MDNSSESDSSETETVGAHLIGSVHSSNTKDEAFATLLLGNQNCEVKFKLDTGAQVNVIPLKKFRQMNMKETNFNPTNIKLTGYGGMRLKVKGKCDVQCKYKDSRCVISFYIVDTDSPAMFGLDTCTDLGLLKLVMSPSTSSEVDRILHKYNCVFKGIGCLRDPCPIKIDKSLNPVIHPTRRIPIKATLDEMEKNGGHQKTMGQLHCHS